MRIIRIIHFLASKIFNFFCCRVTSLSASAFRSISLPLSPRRRALYTFAFACKHFISLKFYKPVNTSFLNRSPSGEARIIPAFALRATPFCNYFFQRTINIQIRPINAQLDHFEYKKQQIKVRHFQNLTYLKQVILLFTEPAHIELSKIGSFGHKTLESFHIICSRFRLTINKYRFTSKRILYLLT